jgi:hypothetical protein
MFLVMILLACFSVSAPAATAKYIVLPSGDHGYSIRCDNDGMNSCYEIAGDICRHGYAIQNQSVQPGFVAEGSSYVGPGIAKGTVLGAGSTTAFSTSDNGLLVLCKDPEDMEIGRLARLRAEEEAREARAMKENRTYLMILGVTAVVMGIIFGVVAANK